MAGDKNPEVQLRELVDAHSEGVPESIRPVVRRLVGRFAEAELSVGVNFEYRNLWGEDQDPTVAAARDRFADCAYKEVILGGRILDAAAPRPDGTNWYDFVQTRAVGVVEQIPAMYGGYGNEIVD